MADTKRALVALQALLPDNNTKQISPQDQRDVLVSVHGDVGYGSAEHTTAVELKDAVDKKHSNSADHTQGTDQKLDEGGPNEVAAANVKDAVGKKHTQGTDTALGAMASNINMNTHKIVGVVDPESAQEAATKNYVENPSGPVSEFIFLSRTDCDKGSAQGVCTDGMFYYTTASAEGVGVGSHRIILKWDMNWNLVASRDVTLDAPTSKEQINSIFYRDDKLYIGTNNYNTVPNLGWIVIYNASDLSYVSNHAVKAYYCEGCAYYDGYWWVIYHNWKYVSKYNASWVWQADYELTYTINPIQGYYNGVMWIGDYLYANIHEGSDPQKCDCYHWTGSGFDEVVRLDPPSSVASQGIFLCPDGKTVLWAERCYGGVPIQDHRVVETLIRR